MAETLTKEERGRLCDPDCTPECKPSHALCEKALRAIDQLTAEVAAANALLADAVQHLDHEPLLVSEIELHLSGQPAARLDHDRAVLDACAKAPTRALLKLKSDWDGVAEPRMTWAVRVGLAELARREAQRG